MTAADTYIARLAAGASQAVATWAAEVAIEEADTGMRANYPRAALAHALFTLRQAQGVDDPQLEVAVAIARQQLEERAA